MDMNALFDQIKAEAAVIDKTMQEDLASIESPLLQKVLNHAIFNGGKRIRPLLNVLASRLCSKEDETIYKLSIVFEYLHAASLLHDDVIDHADQRRGHDTANAVWGNTSAILAGDYLHTRAMLLAGTIGGEQCLEIISQATSAMVESEFLQMQTAQDINIADENYYAVLRGKTAALISAACETGIWHTGGNKEQAVAMQTYGTNLGLAFQIVDDLLDYLGDPAKTGKIVGNDFQEGKMTLPLIYMLNKAKDDDRNFLLDLLNADGQKRLAQVETVRNLIETTGGFEYAKQSAKDLIDSAINELHIFKDCPAKEILIGLAHYVLIREK